MASHYEFAGVYVEVQILYWASLSFFVYVLTAYVIWFFIGITHYSVALAKKD